jgi:DNA-binding transcriptional MerR regulator
VLNIGYSSYSGQQLARVHRVVALRDMSFHSEQIRQVMSEDISVEELRGMLRLRQAQIEQAVREEQDRLRRVEAYLRALEWRDVMECRTS